MDLSQGACVGIDTEIFFPKAGRPWNPAWKDYCSACSVRLDCLKFGTVHEEMGIWGGLTQKERDQIAPEIVAAWKQEAQDQNWWAPVPQLYVTPWQPELYQNEDTVDLFPIDMVSPLDLLPSLPELIPQIEVGFRFEFEIDAQQTQPFRFEFE